MAMRGNDWTELSFAAQTEVFTLFHSSGRVGCMDHIFAVRRVSTALGALLVCDDLAVASWRSELDAALEAAREAVRPSTQAVNS
jgi:hypothetical protein